MGSKHAKYQKLMIATLLVVVVFCVFANDYRMIVYYGSGESYYNVHDIDSVTFHTDSIRICGINEKYSCLNVNSIVFAENSNNDTLNVIWEGENAVITNSIVPQCTVWVDSSYVRINYWGKKMLNISVQGYSGSGNLVIDSESPVRITSNGLFLYNPKGESINILSNNTTFDIQGKTILSDASTRDTISSNKACLYCSGNLTVTGTDTLLVAGNYKHAIQSSKEIITKTPIEIINAVGDGIKCKKMMTVSGGTISINNIGNNAISVEKGNFQLKNGTVNVTLLKENTKGIKADSMYIQTGGKINLNLFADQCKGIKALKGVDIQNGFIEGKANGGVVIESGYPSYCTFIKCDSDIVVRNSFMTFDHEGSGGKCIAADNNMAISNSEIYAVLSGNGGSYINYCNEEDYYTPRVLDADNNLTVSSGLLDFLCKGTGAKGMTCGEVMTIGEVDANNDKLTMNIVTEGSCLVNNIDEDFRNGCPKAIKSQGCIYVLSGRISIKTLGAGGEGLEGKKFIYVHGGLINCDTYDDSFNAGNDISIYGGDIICKSSRNDGLDSNGSIHIYGGNVLAITEDDINESIDTENHCLYIYGGNILGIGRGDVIPTVSTVPYYNYSKFIGGIKPSPNINFEKGKYISVCKDGKSIISIKNDCDFYTATMTIATPVLVEGVQYEIIECEGIENIDYILLDKYIWCGGLPINAIKKFDFVPRLFF